MSDFILHQYDASPFAEKVRLICGFKNITYRTVNIPVIMPKPDLMALTGGYRKTPVLQSGAHVYCDTRLISRVLDEYSSAPTLYPSEHTASANILAQWVDQSLFSIAVTLAFSPQGFAAFAERMPPQFVEAFVADRAAMSNGERSLAMPLEAALAQLPIYLQQFDQQLHHGGLFLMGDEPTIADFSVYHCLWFINNNAGVNHHLEPFINLRAWLDNMASLGHGKAEQVSSDVAIEEARKAPSETFENSGFLVLNGFEFGANVAVQAIDYGVNPVVGELVASRLDEVVIKRTDERAGEVYVHFPRVGYELLAQ